MPRTPKTVASAADVVLDEGGGLDLCPATKPTAKAKAKAKAKSATAPTAKAKAKGKAKARGHLEVIIVSKWDCYDIKIRLWPRPHERHPQKPPPPNDERSLARPLILGGASARGCL